MVEVVAVNRAPRSRPEADLPDPDAVVLEQQRRADRPELTVAHRHLRPFGPRTLVVRWRTGRRCARLRGVSTPLHHLEPVGLDFLTSAPVRFDYTTALP